VPEHVSDLLDGNSLVDHSGCQTVAEQVGAATGRWDARTQQMLAYDVSNPMGGGEGAQGSFMAQEDLGKGNTWTPVQQVVSNGGTDGSRKRQNPLTPCFGFS
jgi:hypothetical protein